MSEKDINNTIDHLVNELKPVKSFWSAEKRTLIFFLFNLFGISFLMLLVGPFRPTLAKEFTHVSYITEVIYFFITLVCLSYFYFLSLVPGAIKLKRIKIAYGLFITLVLYFIGQMLTTNHPYTTDVHRGVCYLEVAALALIPLNQLFYFAKKGFYSQNTRSYVLAGLSAALIPAFLMHFMCQTNYKHILFFHIGPVFLVVFLAVYFFQKKCDSAYLSK